MRLSEKIRDILEYLFPFFVFILLMAFVFNQVDIKKYLISYQCESNQEEIVGQIYIETKKIIKTQSDVMEIYKIISEKSSCGKNNIVLTNLIKLDG